MVSDAGIPGYLNKELNFAEAFTETITTQCPVAQIPALGLTLELQVAAVIVPPLSHPQET
jgi:hypothetical protein